MKVLVIGKGGREDAIIKSLKKSDKISQLYALPGNGGTELVAKNIAISELDNEKIIDFIKEEKIDFVVVAPDNPLANGLIDLIEKEKIPSFGPTKKAAQIESSKIFAKKLMTKYNIPTAKYEIFDDYYKAVKYLDEKNEYPIVIKADGLAFGKGVVVAKNFQEASKAVEDMIKNEKFKESGKKIIIEEFLEGIEVSMLTFTDGKTIVPMVSCLDHKRAFENDKGPNTGGMGAVCPNPAYTEMVAKICEEEIFIPTIKAMQKENAPFKGCLYFGLMVTKKGPKVIEYNSRFGDPETQAILPLLKTDLFTIMQATYEEKLETIKIEFEKKCSACIILASKGYPEKYITGYEINIKDFDEKNCYVFHSGTKLENNILKTASGRVLSVCCVEKTLESAIENAYKAIEKIKFKDMQYRKDIGKKALKLLKDQPLNVNI